MKADQCIESSRMKMLPDVGMAKTYPKRLEAGDWWPWLFECHGIPDPCSWTFSTSWTVHHPYISTCFCGKLFTTLVSVLFTECKLVYIQPTNQLPPSLQHWLHEAAVSHCTLYSERLAINSARIKNSRPFPPHRIFKWRQQNGGFLWDPTPCAG